MTSHVELPGRRYELIGSFEDLADFEMQKNKWCNNKYQHSFSDNMSLSAGVILDEADLDKEEYAIGKIGYWFRDRKEAMVSHEAAKTLKKATGSIGYDKPNEEYLTSPLWQEVVKAAKDAYDVLMIDEDLDKLVEQEKNRV
jgi:hypothetical protein